MAFLLFLSSTTLLSPPPSLSRTGEAPEARKMWGPPEDASARREGEDPLSTAADAGGGGGDGEEEDAGARAEAELEQGPAHQGGRPGTTDSDAVVVRHLVLPANAGARPQVQQRDRPVAAPAGGAGNRHRHGDGCRH